MSYLHVVVIHDIGQVICWITIGLQQNGIVINTVHRLEELLLTVLVLPCRSKYEIFEFWVLVRFQPDNMCFSLCHPFFYVFGRYVNALAIVSELKAGFVALSGKGV